MHFLSPENPFAKKGEGAKQPPTDTSVIEALLGTEVAEQFHASAPATENPQETKVDLLGGVFALSAEEVARVNAREQEQTLEQQARTWFLSLGKDEDWIEKHFNFEDGITCIQETLDLSHCNIAKLPSFFKEIRKITHLNLTKNLLTTLKNIPKEIEGDLFLFDNPKLASLTGLEGVHVGRDLSLSNNPSLASYTGLRGVTVGGNIYLNHNPKLASLVGLEGVHVGRDLFLYNNPRLASLEGLPPKENIGGSLVFSEDQENLIQEARKKGYKRYKIHVITT